MTVGWDFNECGLTASKWGRRQAVPLLAMNTCSVNEMWVSYLSDLIVFVATESILVLISCLPFPLHKFSLIFFPKELLVDVTVTTPLPLHYRKWRPTHPQQLSSVSTILLSLVFNAETFVQEVFDAFYSQSELSLHRLLNQVKTLSKITGKDSNSFSEI